MPPPTTLHRETTFNPSLYQPSNYAQAVAPSSVEQPQVLVSQQHILTQLNENQLKIEIMNYQN